MSSYKHILPVIITLTLTACGVPRLPASVVQSSPVPGFSAGSGAGDGFALALAAYQVNDGETAFSLARQVTELFPNTPWYKRSLFLMERSLILLDRPSEADAAMLRVQAEYPELSDYAVFLLAEYYYTKAQYSRAAALYRHLMDKYPKSALVLCASFQRGRALQESYAYSLAADAFERFLQDNPRSEYAPAAGMGLGRALTAEADLPGAVRAYQDVWIQYPGYPNDQEVEKALAELKAGGAEIPAVSAADLYERGKNLFRAAQYDKTVETFAKLLEREPDTPNRADVLFRSGVALYYLNRRSEAAGILEKMTRQFPADARTAEALYWMGRSYSKLGIWDKSVKTFQRILDRFPESDWADDALFLIGNIYRETNDMKKLIHFYGRLAEEYPESSFADSAIWWRAWAYYTAGDHDRAEQALQRLVTRYPRSFLVNQATYWRGRIAEQRGDQTRAVAYYAQVLRKGEYTYYGHRAAARLARIDASADLAVQMEAPEDVIVPCSETLCTEDLLHPSDADESIPVRTEETKQLLSADPAFCKTLELLHLEMKKEAAAELWSLQENMPRRGRGSLIGLSKAFFELGDYYRSIMLVLRNYERYLETPRPGVSEYLWLLAYPQGYWENIVAAAKKYGQDPYFVAAIIRQESQFRAEAISPAGARGLMQVMPATGAWAARLNNISGFDREKLFESATAIDIGTWYLSYLMKRFKGDRLLVAAAYNAGPDPVASWIAKNVYSADRDAFVESIPYSETRGYVKKVLRNYEEYKRLYGTSAEIAAEYGM